MKNKSFFSQKVLDMLPVVDRYAREFETDSLPEFSTNRRFTESKRHMSQSFLKDNSFKPISLPYNE